MLPETFIPASESSQWEISLQGAKIPGREKSLNPGTIYRPNIRRIVEWIKSHTGLMKYLYSTRIVRIELL